MKVLAVLVILIGIVVAVVPQYTNCEYGVDRSKTTIIIQAGSAAEPSATFASMGGMDSVAAAAGLPYRMMKCFWSAHAEIVVGVTLVVTGLLLLFARRRETMRALGIVAAVLGVFTILIPTELLGTCANTAMVCNTTMKPVLLVGGGIAVAIGIAVVVAGQLRRDAADAAV